MILPDGSAWIFDRKVICMNGEEIFQVTAMDATELYAFSSKLKRENFRAAQHECEAKSVRPQGG